MPVFPSVEWIDAYCEQLAAQPDAREFAEALEGTYRFVVEPAGPLTRRHEYDVLIAPERDGIVAQRVEQPDQPPRLTMAATYPRWRELIRGELDVPRALLLRRLTVGGDVAALRGRLGTTRPLTRALGAVDSRWLEA